MLDHDYPELGLVRIATPCPMRWADMDGDGPARHCGRCAQTVFNFAELDSEEARQLLRKHAAGGRICARIFLRADGTVLTKDCPKGYPYALRWARRWALPALLVPVVAFAFLVVSSVVDSYRQLRAMSGQLQVISPPAHAPVRHR